MLQVQQAQPCAEKLSNKGRSRKRPCLDDARQLSEQHLQPEKVGPTLGQSEDVVSLAIPSVGMPEGVSQVSILSVPSSRAAQHHQMRDECSQLLYDEITDGTEVLRSVTDSTESNLIVFDGTVGGQIVHILANTGASQQYIK